MLLIPTKDNDRISYAPIVVAEGAFYVIGGYTSFTAHSTIARLDSTTYEWSAAGNLLKGRHGHNAIFDGSDIIVVGGYPGNDESVKTEKCTITEGRVSCVQQNPSLVNYSYYPELFLVEDGFCKELP